MTDTCPPIQDWPLYWFAQLEQAIDRGEFEQAAEAARQLRRLGVEVRYRRGMQPDRQQKRGKPHAF
jgi:hypothetical protein